MEPETMSERNLVRRAHRLVAEILVPGDRAIDATVGNGADTAWLAQRVGVRGQVYGFGVQERAHRQSERHLIRLGLRQRVTLFPCGHERMSSMLPKGLTGTIRAVMFNLGYPRVVIPYRDQNRDDAKSFASLFFCTVLRGVVW